MHRPGGDLARRAGRTAPKPPAHSLSSRPPPLPVLADGCFVEPPYPAEPVTHATGGQLLHPTGGDAEQGRSLPDIQPPAIRTIVQSCRDFASRGFVASLG